MTLRRGLERLLRRVHGGHERDGLRAGWIGQVQEEGL